MTSNENNKGSKNPEDDPEFEGLGLDSQPDPLDELFETPGAEDNGDLELEDSDLILSRAFHDTPAPEKPDEEGQRNSVADTFRKILGSIAVPRKLFTNKRGEKQKRESLRKREEQQEDAKEDQTIEEMLGDTYGAPTTPESGIKNLLRNKVLVAGLLTAAIGVLAIGAVNMLDYDLSRFFDFQVSRSKDVAGQPSASVQAATQEEPTTPAQFEIDIKQALSHCSVSEHTRERFLQSLGSNLSVVDETNFEALHAILRFQNNYDSKKIGPQLALVEEKRAILVALTQPALSNIDDKLSSLYANRTKIEQQLAVARTNLERLEEAARKAKVQTINELIRVRAEVDRLTAAANRLPAHSGIRSLRTQLAVLESALTTPITDQAPTPIDGDRDPWISDIRAMSLEKFRERAERLVNTGLLETSRQFEDPLAELVQLRIQQTTDTAKQLTDALSFLRLIHTETLDGLSVEQVDANHRINELIGSTDKIWLDHTLCQVKQSNNISQN
ncbi:MAG: hypothetical protein OEU36_05130 [Gammaproteobacteria bacterium]|nr:hypothetical protein [Gammaproteobacteria bacterium]